MNILIASSIFPDAIDELGKNHDVICAFNAAEDVLKSKIADREVLIFRSGVTISADVMSAAPNLKLLIRAGSGTDNLDLDYVQKNEIRLVRVPEPGAKAVSELAFALMLSLARNVVEADRLTKKGRWAKSELSANGYLLTGKTLGIVGAGIIGGRVGRMGAAWGMNAIGCVDPPTEEDRKRLQEDGIRMATFDEVVAKADFLSVHTPLMDSTRNLIGSEAFTRMKPGACIVSLARGGVVNEAALRDALTSGKLRGAGLDVHENEGEGKISPVADLPNVVLTPHMGAGTVDSQREIGERVLEIMSSFLATETAS